MHLCLLAVLMSAAISPDVPNAQTPTEIARQGVSHFQPEIGRWSVVNSVMQGPGDLKELYFVVETSPVLDGLGVRTSWFEAETGDFFGEVIRTYNPATEALDQHYFAAASSSWSATSQDIVFDENGYSTGFSGEDRYGSFEARAKTIFLPDGGGYDWTIERRYDGGDWFVIDRGAARPLSDAN